MDFGATENLTGLFCWEATFGFGLLLMDGSRFCILNIEEVREDLLGAMVEVRGKRIADSVLVVEEMSPWACG